MRMAVLVAVCFLAAALHAQTTCPCDPKDPDTLKERQCALCAAAEKLPPGIHVFFLQDTSPRKPNRWLALPRQHSPGMHEMSSLDALQRNELWTDAISKAKELWGEKW